MFLIIFLILLIILTICDFLYKRKTNKIFKQSGIPGPYALPLVGNALLALGNDTASIFRLISRLTSEYGKLLRVWILYEPFLLVQDVKYVEKILSSQQVIKKNILYDLLRTWLGDGLLLSTGKKWHTRRKIITPTFHFKILEQYVEIFDQQSSILMKKLYVHADGQTTVNIFPIICVAALDIIAETAMGVKINAQMHPEFPYAKAMANVAEIVGKRLLNLTQYYDLGFELLTPIVCRKLRKNIDIMHEFTDKVIEERRLALQKAIADGSYQSLDDELIEVGLKKRMAFLDVLLQSTVAGSPLSNEDIREEVDTFMFEGHDTTTSGISHTLYLIARHPEVQEKLYQEIVDVIGDNKHKSTSMRELQELRYLECVIKEALRLYPSVPMIGRRTEQDVVIHDKVIPAHTNVFVMIYAISRDPEYFAKPNDFIPERFMGDEAAKIDPFAYVPFSAGPRNCIGQKFAMLEMKSMISKVLRHFELLPLGPETNSIFNLILRSATGINLGLKPRIH